MEIKQLRYFKRVADAGSVSRAAAALSVAQPAVSRQIANLEEALGTPLFFRNGRGVKLTEAGKQLYAHTNDILDAVRHAEQNVRDTVGVAKGTLLIGSTPTVVRYIAPPLLRRIARSHPELDLEFTEGFSGYVNEWLSNGLLDVAILHDATRTQHFLTEPLLREELVFVADASGDCDTGPVALSEMAAHRLVLPRRSHGLRLLVERTAAQSRVTFDVAAEVDSVEAIKSMVREDRLATILPRGAVSPGEGFTVRPICEPAMSRTLILATSSQRPVSQTTRAVIQELKAVVRVLADDELWPGSERYTDRAPSFTPKGAVAAGVDRPIADPPQRLV
ncbi:LysR family transcriptional regulator [Acuticoccus sp. I52.16.1]|uniref:LysR family transcriptional regulator n=1 Tax=Acuticoccus sp. I52.16.1 TaxID=2928472 RepID=UPI001FD59169|nr:LysR family transcriptional regulator [Acuticoccus sp. I52.16.1]UOM34652.1 LysR family transcriptional regulator [Acuticoccus sp. I52.16.1]